MGVEHGQPAAAVGRNRQADGVGVEGFWAGDQLGERAVGGHLLAGCRVYTTAEVVLGEARDLVFTRAVDGTTPWRELQIARRRGR